MQYQESQRVFVFCLPFFSFCFVIWFGQPGQLHCIVQYTIAQHCLMFRLSQKLVRPMFTRTFATINSSAPRKFRLPHVAAAAAGAVSFSFATFASCTKSKSEILKEMSESTSKIESMLAAEKKIESLEERALASKGFQEMSFAGLQLHVTDNKARNLVNAREKIVAAAAAGAKIICLPECFNSPYDTSCFPKYSEPIPETASALDPTTSPSTAMLLEVAKSCGIYLVGGSIPERGTDGNVYNTCVIVNPEGEIVGKHRKMHLFDISIPGGITFKESDTLTAGKSFTTFDTEYGRIGVGICYDLRFPEQSAIMREKGCKMLIFPGAFNMTTGPAHWELLLRARALDNQCYVAAVSPARDETAGYHAWGHSTVISPWGDIVATTEHQPATIHATVDFTNVDNIRQNIPVSKQKRNDLYELNEKSKL